MGTKHFLLIMVVGLAALLATGAGTAEAAKGVKKKGEHKIQGIVVAVDHHKHGGTLTVKTRNHHKKKNSATAAAGQKGKGHVQKFHVGKDTKITAGHGQKHHPVSFAALHKGEHVTILAKGHQAEKVEIHRHHAKKKGKKLAQ